MVDRAKKLSELTVTTAISNSDLVPIVANTSGTKVNKTITFDSLANAFSQRGVVATNTYVLFGANSVATGSANLTFTGTVLTIGNSSVNTTISPTSMVVGGLFTATTANVVLGTAGSGNATIRVLGAVSSNVGPDTPNNYFLGNTSHPWKTLWASTIRTANITYTDTDIVIQMGGSTDSYLQTVLQNASAAANASTNYNVSADTADATSNFGEFGINSSTFSGSGRFSDPLAVYVGAATSNLALGTYGNYPVNIVVNSSINWTFGTNSSLTLPNGPAIFTGNATTRAAVNTQVGTAGSNGSIYLSTAGKIYLRVNGTGTAATDWQRVTTTAVD